MSTIRFPLALICGAIAMVASSCTIMPASPHRSASPNMPKHTKTVGGQAPSDPPPTAPAIQTDVVVWGSTTAGLMAAAASASAGERTWLISSDPAPGGLITQAWLTVLDMNWSRRGLLTRGAFARFYLAMGQKESVSLPLAGRYFNRLAYHTPHLTTRLKATLLAVTHHAGTVSAVEVRQGGTVFWIHARRFIDASYTASLAARSGAPTFIGHQDIGGEATMPAATLIFRLRGVRWSRVIAYTGRHRLGTSWGYGRVDFADHQLPKGMRLRGMNLSLQPDGTVLVNALWVNGVNPLNPQATKAQYARAKAALPQVVSYLNQHAPGFSRATLAGAAPQFYVRQSRQIYALHQLTASEELQNRCFKDRVAMGNYPVDIQGGEGITRGIAVLAPSAYSIPLSSLIPRRLKNLLVVGPAAGYTSVAQGSARVLPIGMAEGQAAGLATVLSLKHHVTFPALDQGPLVATLQNEIRAHRGFLTCFAPAYPLSHSWIWPYFKIALDHMLISGGYSNNFHLHAPVSEMQFANRMTAEKQLLTGPAKAHYRSIPWTSSKRPMTLEAACNDMLKSYGQPPHGGCQAAVAARLLPASTLQHLHSGTLTRAEGLVLAVSLAKALNAQFPSPTA